MSAGRSVLTSRHSGRSVLTSGHADSVSRSPKGAEGLGLGRADIPSPRARLWSRWPSFQRRPITLAALQLRDDVNHLWILELAQAWMRRAHQAPGAWYERPVGDMQGTRRGKEGANPPEVKPAVPTRHVPVQGR